MAVDDKTAEICKNCTHWDGDGSGQQGECKEDRDDIVVTSWRDDCIHFINRFLDLKNVFD